MVSGQRDVQAQRQDGVAEAEWCGLGRSQNGKPFSRGFILPVRVNMESNVDRIESWVKQWKKDNAEQEDGAEGQTDSSK